MSRLSTLLAAAGLVLTAVATAQGPRATATLTVDKSTIAAGGTVTGKLSITFPDGYHAYQNPPTDEFEIPVKVDLAKTSKFKLVKVSYPKGIPMAVGGETKPSAVYTDTITIPVTLKAPSTLGASSIDVTVNYQQCNASSCMPPDTLELVAKVTIKAAPKKATKPKKS